MKKLTLTVSMLFLFGCDGMHPDNAGINNTGAEWKEYTSHYVLPADLKDCKVFFLRSPASSSSRNVTVVKCPFPVSVEYQEGKAQTAVSVI